VAAHNRYLHLAGACDANTACDGTHGSAAMHGSIASLVNDIRCCELHSRKLPRHLAALPERASCLCSGCPVRPRALPGPARQGDPAQAASGQQQAGSVDVPVYDRTREGAAGACYDRLLVALLPVPLGSCKTQLMLGVMRMTQA